MARPATDAWYRVRLATLAREGYRAAKIARILEEEARDEGRTDYPSARTVHRLYSEYLRLPEDEKRQQSYFRWPDAMLSGALPWEAAPAALELLREHDRAGIRRPTVRHAKWFWRLRLATPDMPMGDAYLVAAALAVDEYAKVTGAGGIDLGGLDRQLAYHPWTSEKDLEAYVEASRRSKLPHWTQWNVSGDLIAIQKQWVDLTAGLDPS